MCVPIKADARTVGALGVTLPFEAERSFDEEQKFFGIVGSMIGQAVRVHKLIESERRRLLDENTKLRQELQQRYDIRNIVGTSRPMQQVYEQVAQVAAANTTVLLRGESGTGKELVAHAIHYSSPRAKKPFVKVSCGALPESLIESRALRLRAGGLHRRARPEEGPLRAGPRRHALPRRGGRAVASPPR